MQRPKVPLQLVTVQQSDIEEMLDCYDSGMSDVQTSNAVALALKRLLKPGHDVRVCRDSKTRKSFAQIDDNKFSLPDDTFDWLQQAEQVSPVKPLSFGAALPENWLQRPAEFPQEANTAERMAMTA